MPSDMEYTGEKIHYRDYWIIKNKVNSGEDAKKFIEQIKDIDLGEDVEFVIEKKIKSQMSLFIFRAEDSTGKVSVKWFSFIINLIRIGQVM